jgi:hypothetical protein
MTRRCSLTNCGDRFSGIHGEPDRSTINRLALHVTAWNGCSDPVTAEVAGSSPVVPATHFSNFRELHRLHR